jgi:phosphoserine phosphatase
LRSANLCDQAVEFIASVLALKPSLAVFDCDGTLWSGDAGADFFYWEIARGIVSREMGERALARYKEYAAGQVSEEQMCGEMVTLNRGVPCGILWHAAEEFFGREVRPRIFPAMQELVSRLIAQGCELWAVSSTNKWVVDVAAEHFGFAGDRVLAACVEVEEGCATERLIRVPTDELKAIAIREVIGRAVDMAFGNSIHDVAMLELAKHPFCINPNPDLEEVAHQRGWPVYRPVAVAR